MKITFSLFVTFQFLIILAPNNAFSQNYNFVPLGISYQGILKAAEGDSIVSDGIHPMRFYLYDAATDGNLLWQQPPIGQGSQLVETKKGVFNVILGSYGTQENDLLQSVINSSPGNRWLEVEAYGEILSPRTKLFSNPFSYRSIVADSCRKSIYSLVSDSSSFAINSGRSFTSDSSQLSISSIHSDSANYALNSNQLGGLDRQGFIEENEPNTIDSTMIRDGSVSRADLGFSAFHQVGYIYADNNIIKSANLSWQDIDSLYMEINIDGDSILAYISLNIQRFRLPTESVEIRITVDNIEIISSRYSYYNDGGGSHYIYSSINLNRIVPVDTGHHIIKGQFRRLGENPQNLEGKERNLIAIILK